MLDERTHSDRNENGHDENRHDQSEHVEATGDSRLHGAATGVVGGLIATLVMSAFRIPISRSPPPTAAFWARFLGDGEPEDYAGRGLILHLLYGTVGGGIFGALVGPHLAGTEAHREEQAALLGTGYGVLLSLFGVPVLLERLLGMSLEEDERFVFHMSHVVYGLTLGTWFGSNA